jgi:hypothetical protein
MSDDVFDDWVDRQAKIVARLLPAIAEHHGADPPDLVEWFKSNKLYDDYIPDRLPRDEGLLLFERRIIGCLMVDDDALRMVDDLIEPETFFWPGHGRLYRKIRDLIRAGKRRTLANLDVSSEKQVEYLADMICEATTIVAIRIYAEMLAAAAIEYST